MSALPPIETAKADMRKWSCPLCPQKQTCAVHWLMSALGQKRTFDRLLDQLIGAEEQWQWDANAERLGRFQIDGQFKLGRLQDREVPGHCAFENPINVCRAVAILVSHVRSVTHQPAGRDVVFLTVNHDQSVPVREGDNLRPMHQQRIVGQHQQSVAFTPTIAAKAELSSSPPRASNLRSSKPSAAAATSASRRSCP